MTTVSTFADTALMAYITAIIHHGMKQARSKNGLRIVTVSGMENIRSGIVPALYKRIACMNLANAMANI